MRLRVNNRFISFDVALFEKVTTDIVTKANWEKLWRQAQESQYGHNKLMNPYEQYPWLYICVNEIAKPISQMEFQFFTGKDSLLESGDVYDLFKKPNPYMSGSQMWQAILTFLAMDGNVFVVSWDKRRGSKLPREMYVFGKDSIECMRSETTGQLIAWKLKGKNPVLLEPEQVVHLKLFNPSDQILGLSPLTVARMTMDSDFGAMKFNKSMMDNQAEPSGMLLSEKKLTDDQIEQITKQFEARHKGTDNAGRMAIMYGMKYQKITLSQRDMEFLESRRYNREEMLAIYNIPKGCVGITDDLNYATLFGQKKILWQDTLLPYVKQIEDGFESNWFPQYAPELYGRFDRKSVPELQDDFSDKVETAKDLHSLGYPINMINERLDLGMKDVPWGDTWFAPANVIPVSMIGQEPKGNGKDDDKKALVEAITPDEILVPAIKVFSEMEEDDKAKREFIRVITPLEQRFTNKMRRFFFEQRNQVLRALNANGKSVKTVEEAVFYNWEDEERKLIQMTEPLFKESLNAGMQLAGRFLGDVSFDLQNPVALEAMERRADKITRVGATVKEQIRRTLQQGITGAESVYQLSDRVKDVYDMARHRALTIARTEVVGATNEGQYIALQEHGVAKKRWLTAQDEAVRDSHVLCGQAGAIDMDKTFPNGLSYPSDSSGAPEEVINCRCTLLGGKTERKPVAPLKEEPPILGDTWSDCKNLTEAETQARLMFPDTVFDFKGFHPNAKTANQTMREYTKVAKQYPDVAKTIKYVGTYLDDQKFLESGMKSVAPSKWFYKGKGYKWKAGNDAHCWQDLSVSSKKGQVIGLNPDYFGLDAEDYLKNLRFSEASGWHPKGTGSTIGSTITHEFAHAIDHYLTYGTQGKHLLPFSGWEVDSQVRTFHKLLIKNNADTKKQRLSISDYAEKGDDPLAESFAEGFNELLYSPKKGRSKYAQKLDIYLKKYVNGKWYDQIGDNVLTLGEKSPKFLKYMEDWIKIQEDIIDAKKVT